MPKKKTKLTELTELTKELMKDKNITDVADLQSILKEMLKSGVETLLATENATKKWSQRQRNWDQIINELSILPP